VFAALKELQLRTLNIFSDLSISQSAHLVSSPNILNVQSFTNLKVYINLFRGHVQCFELS
jgi:hypothetical protein